MTEKNCGEESVGMIEWMALICFVRQCQHDKTRIRKSQSQWKQKECDQCDHICHCASLYEDICKHLYRIIQHWLTNWGHYELI